MQMMEFFSSLESRDPVLFRLGLAHFILAAGFLLAGLFSQLQVQGVNAWWKPLKFALSIGIYAWSIGWYQSYLGPDPIRPWISWTIVVTMVFEMVYIGIQAGRGQMSHFNLSTPVYQFLYAGMAIAATIGTLAGGLLGLKLCMGHFPDLPEYYLWAVRLGILLFVVFGLEGFAMGSRLTHSIGEQGDKGFLAFLGWSKGYGDLRIAHFLGMHALQILPLLAWYLLRNTSLVFTAAAAYGGLAVFTLVRALQGRVPFW
jgi:hypothetical protein